MVEGHRISATAKNHSKGQGLLRAHDSKSSCNAMLIALHLHTCTHLSPPPPSCCVPGWLTPLGCIIWGLDGFGQWEPPGRWEIRRNESRGISSLFLPSFESWSWQWLGPSVILGRPPWVQFSPISGPTLSTPWSFRLVGVQNIFWLLLSRCLISLNLALALWSEISLFEPSSEDPLVSCIITGDSHSPGSTFSFVVGTPEDARTRG